MTVLETEENADKRSVPPRKKFCLSLSGRRRAVPIVDPQPPPTSTRGGLLDSTDFSFSTYISFLYCDILPHSVGDGCTISILKHIFDHTMIL